MSIPLLANLKYIIGSCAIGLVLAFFIYFSTEQYHEYRHSFEVRTTDLMRLKKTMKRTYLDDIDRKVYFDPYFTLKIDTAEEFNTFQIQHFFTGEKQISKDLDFFFLHNGVITEYANTKLNYTRYDGSGRLAQRAIGIFLLFSLLGVVLQRLSSCKKEKNKEDAK